MQRYLKKIGCHSNDVSPRPLQYREMKHNSAVTRQLAFWNQKAKQIFSWQSKNVGP